jgi:hypothetical protein
MGDVQDDAAGGGLQAPKVEERLQGRADCDARFVQQPGAISTDDGEWIAT